MAIAPEIPTSIPARLVAALHAAGMPAHDIARIYRLSMEEVRFALCAPPEPLSVEDMELVREDGHTYELWEGELWRMAATKKQHGRGAVRVIIHLGRYLEINPIGSIYTAEVGFRVGRRRRLLCPDVAYVCNERDTPVGDDEFFPYAPDIAVEVLSPDNSRPKVRQKARAYLADGGRLVWAMDTRRKAVTVFRPLSEPQVLPGQDTLSGEDVLPGFAVRVADLF
jgi:Uma2 family endonuclease